MPKLISPEDMPRVGLQSGQVVRADTTDVSAGFHALAAGIGDIGHAAADLQARERQADAKNADLWAAEQISDALYNPDKGYLGLRQKDAVGGYEAFDARLNEIRTTALSQVQDERARSMLDDMIRQRSLSARQQGGRHLYSERVSYLEGTASAVMDRASRDMAAAPGDYGAVSMAIDTIEGQAREIGRLKGEGPDQIEVRVSAARSEALVSQIETVATEDPLAAESLFRSVEDRLDPAVRGRVSNFVEAKRDAWQVEQGLGFETPDEFRAATKRNGGTVTRAQGRQIAGNAGYVYGALTEKGIPPHIAAGIVGNLQQESGQGLNPASHNTKGENSFGIAQWNGSRHRDLERFAAERGMPKADLDTQIEFMLHEFETSEAGNWAKIQAATTAEEATLLFSKHYERASDPRNENRLRNAKGIEDKLGTAGVADPRFAGMSKDAREKVLTALNRKVDAALLRRKQEFDDDIVALETGIATPDKVPSRKDLTSEFGAEAGGRIADRFEDAVVVNEDLTTISSSNAKDIAARRAEIAENVASLGDDEADTRRLENFDKALNTHAEQVRKDPAGAALAEDETAANIVASLQNRDPAEQGAGLKALIQRSVAAQGEKGVQAFGAEVRALPKAVAETMARTLEGTQPEQLGAVLTALRADMGDMYFDAALEQMVTDAKLDDQIIPIALFSNDQSAMRFLERARDIDIDEVKKRVEKDSQTSVKEAINESVRPYLLAIGADDPNSTRINQGLAVAGLLEKAALAKVATGMEPEDAVAAVMAATIEQGYSIIAEEGGTRVIADRNTADEDTLEAAIDVMMDPERLADFKPAFVGGDPVTDAVMARFYARDAYFVTSGDGIGAVLSINVRGEDVPVYDREGKPYGFLFKDAQDVIGSAERTSEIVGDRRSRQTPDIDPLDPSLEEMVGTAIGNPLENISKETETLGQGARDAFDWLTQPAKPGAGRGGRNRRRN